jgi:hypothetical protein
MSIIPKFTIADIQLGVGDHEFTKALDLYTRGSVNHVKRDFSSYSAIVSGTHDYVVNVSSISYDQGNCNCFLGERDELCKHMIALAIALVHKYRPDDTKIIDKPLGQAVCSGKIREITKDEIKEIKANVNKGLSLIKSYNGPSSKWFQYQDNLIKGSRIILLALSQLPVCEKSAMVCIGLLKRLDRKLLNGGIDDSDGTVGDLMIQTVEVLNMFAESDTRLKKYISDKLPKGEVFDWEKGFYAFKNG